MWKQLLCQEMNDLSDTRNHSTEPRKNPSVKKELYVRNSWHLAEVVLFDF